jgi:hypothetical protein
MLQVVVLIAMLLATGCSWQQGYVSAQGWQRNQCQRLPDQTERERCLASSAMPYDQYRRHTEGESPRKL